MGKSKNKRGAVRVEGWGSPSSALEYHYFIQCESLCGKYKMMTEPKRSIPKGLYPHQICQRCTKAKTELSR